MTTRITSSVLANTTVTPGNYGGLTQIPSFAVDNQGRITLAANNAVSSMTIGGSQISSGTVTSTQLSTVGTPGTYGGVGTIPYFSVDNAGRITASGNITNILANTSNLLYTQATTSSASHYITITNAASGNLYNYTSANLTYTPSNGTITAISFNGTIDVQRTNEMTLADGFAGGRLYMNYRGATSAITYMHICDAMGAGSLATVNAAAFVGVGTLVTGVNAASTNGITHTSITTGGIAYAANATAIGSTAAGTAGQVLLSGGAAAPSWVNQNTLQSFKSTYASVANTAQVAESITGINYPVFFNDFAGTPAPYVNQNYRYNAANGQISVTSVHLTNSLGVGTPQSNTAGEIRATNNITAYYSSDKRFKENVIDIPSALEKVQSIGGKLFDWTDEYIKEHGGEDGYFVRKNDFGVIAQDVESVFPIAVRTRNDGSLAVDYEKLCALAFQAIKELKAEVDELKKGK